MIKRLQDIAEITSGFAFKSKEFRDESTKGYPIIRIQNLNQTNTDFKYWALEFDDKYVVNKGDLLLSLSGNVKLDRWSGPVGLLNQRIVKVLPKKGVLKEWLYYFLESIVNEISSLMKKSIIGNISITDIRNIKVDVPPINEQERVIEKLKKTELILGKRQQQIEALSALKQSVFLDMFGDPYRNKNSFDILKLSDIKLDISNGLHLKRDEYDEDGNTAVIWISDFINKGKVDFEDIKKANVDYKRYERYKVSYGDVFFVRSSLTPEGIGKCGFIPNTNADKVIFEDHIIKVRLNNTILPEYFQAFSETTFFRNQIIKQSNTSTMTTINQNSLLDCKVMVAPIKEQQEFIEKVNQIEKNITELTESLSHFEVLYESLLHKAFNGELFKEEIKA